MVLQFHYASSTVFYQTSESTRRTSWQFPLYHISDDAPIRVLQTAKLYKATHKFPEGLKVWKWWSDTAITSRHWSCNLTQNPKLLTLKKNKIETEPKTTQKFCVPLIMLWAKQRDTSQVVANLPWFSTQEFNDILRDHAKNWV